MRYHMIYYSTFYMSSTENIRAQAKTNSVAKLARFEPDSELEDSQFRLVSSHMYRKRVTAISRIECGRLRKIWPSMVLEPHTVYYPDRCRKKVRLEETSNLRLASKCIITDDKTSTLYLDMTNLRCLTTKWSDLLLCCVRKKLLNIVLIANWVKQVMTSIEIDLDELWIHPCRSKITWKVILMSDFSSFNS